MLAFTKANLLMAVSSQPAISVILPTHDPDAGRLQRTLGALAQQTLAAGDHEVIVVDNASQRPLRADLLTSSGIPHGRIVQEPTLGLTSARRRGLYEARGDLCVLVDDDNVLAPTYLAAVQEIFSAHPRLGAAGGPSLPEFEISPAKWMQEFFPLLALRNLGSSAIMAEFNAADSSPLVYPTCAPIGAGMTLRKAALSSWLTSTDAASIPDRCGTALTSGGDNDIVLSVLRAGWRVGYFPELKLTHLIPSSRTAQEYLARLNYGVQRSWVQVLSRHHANPWSPLSRAGCILRQIRAWFVYRAWSSPSAYVRWQGACGHFAGRSTLPTTPAAATPQH